MSDETKRYGEKHLPYHLYEAGMWTELLSVAELRGERIAELERQNELLRGLSMAAQLYISKSVGDPDVFPDTLAAWRDYHANMQAAVDGGSLDTDG